MKIILFYIIILTIIFLSIGIDLVPSLIISVLIILFLKFIIDKIKSNRRTNGRIISKEKNFQIKTYSEALINTTIQTNWIKKGHRVIIGNYEITAGLFYICNTRKQEVDAEVINIALTINKPLEEHIPIEGYWPSYSTLSPVQRGCYLQWLVNDRDDKYPELRDFGYLFLFLYGAERRLLIDKDTDLNIIDELIRIMDIYASYGRSNSLKSYTCQLIYFWAWNQGPNVFNSIWKRMLTVTQAILGEDEIDMILANIYQLDNKLPVEVAYKLISRNDKARSSVVIKRVSKEFYELFTKRYYEEYPDGMILQCSKREKVVEYRPASTNLLFNNSHQIKFKIPNIIGTSSQFNYLINIWNSCIDDLTAYSREKAKSIYDDISIKAHLKLPEELKSTLYNPFQKAWIEVLEGSEPYKDFYIIFIKDLAEKIKIQKSEKLTLKQSIEISEIAESLNYCIVPDARYSRESYNWYQSFGVFPSLEEKIDRPSSTYLAISGILELCVYVATADGEISSKEIEVFSDFISKNSILGKNDAMRLKVLHHNLLDDPRQNKISIARLSKHIPVNKRELIGRVLVEIVCADGIVTKDEKKSLKQIFKSLEIPEILIDKMINECITEFEYITIRKVDIKAKGEKIPIPVEIILDPRIIEKIHKDTEEVRETIIKALNENVKDSSTTEKIELDTTIPDLDNEKSIQIDIPDWINTLETMYQPFVLRIIQYPLINKKDFEEIAREFVLMPSVAYDAINEWSEEKLEDCLLEGEDPILINKNLIPKPME